MSDEADDACAIEGMHLQVALTHRMKDHGLKANGEMCRGLFCSGECREDFEFRVSRS